MVIGESYEMGVSDGWDHGNYVEAYGPTAIPDDAAPGYVTNTAEYFQGFLEGIQRYENGQYPDGSPRD